MAKPVEVEVDSNFNNLRAFFDAMAKLPRIVSDHGFQDQSARKADRRKDAPRPIPADGILCRSDRSECKAGTSRAAPGAAGTARLPAPAAATRRQIDPTSELSSAFQREKSHDQQIDNKTLRMPRGYRRRHSARQRQFFASSTPQRDPFAKPGFMKAKAAANGQNRYRVPASPVNFGPPAIEARIEYYKRLRETAAANGSPLPKVTSVLTLNEMAVTGIFKTPRGYAAMVEATPIKLSYTIYPGEKFFDGQLVAVEENRLVFRR